MGIKVKGNPSGQSGPIDWIALKREVVSKLDVAQEYTNLGLRFSAPAANAKGWRECHAIDRPDTSPSAAVHIPSGVYRDLGGDGAALGLFDFALKHGKHGQWFEVIKHYAAKAGVEVGTPRRSSQGRIRESEHFYREETGTVRYALFRYRLPNGKKSFSQHPSDGRGGWKFGAGCMDGVEPLPYRLPELLASAALDEPVWVLEGEADCDRAALEGLTATTNHQGAMSTSLWERLAPHLKGREVVVVPDNDPAGRTHAHGVAGYLLGVARSVKVVELPDLAAKGDLSDWLDQGGTVEELGRLAAAAPLWDPAQAPVEDDLTRDATAADLVRAGTVISWIWPGWIPAAELTVLASEPGIGKTRFCADLLRRIYQGLPWPDGTPINLPRDSRILWVAADNQHAQLGSLPDAFGFPADRLVLNTSVGELYSGTMLDALQDLQDFEARILRVRPFLAVVDTSINATDGSPNKAEDAKAFFVPLGQIGRRTSTTIVCITHLSGSGQPLGRRIKGQARVVILMDQPNPDEERCRIRVDKSHSRKPPPLGVTVGDNGYEFDTTPPVSPDSPKIVAPNRRKSPRLQETMNWITNYLKLGPQRVSETRNAAEAAGFDAKLLYRARDTLHLNEFEADNRLWWELTSSNGAP